MIFKSEAHRTLFHRMLYEQIRCNILHRFGGMRQHECRILQEKYCKTFIKAWAVNILNRMPLVSCKQRDFISHETSRIPPSLLSNPEIKTLIKENKSLEWFIDRLNDSESLVPKPYFPSVLRNELPQFPFHPKLIDKARELYGLYKFPFYSLTDSMHVEKDEMFKGLKEPGPTVNSTKVEEFATLDSIYAPSEMETGLYDS
ncbi:hypothetical protein BdWA1_001700 [Babesia duncani]|uniref:Uncharacterized protein n=1 Tax=Babesia duncani TaxID=323732 RepID=A0AAD9PKD0_9APIC|nr:hypothetical protein BdWA1_003627 [Babesia duncani]KAK2196454.1 hypothetical protein BdWA1_001700 [Babesia duncani]